MIMVPKKIAFQKKKYLNLGMAMESNIGLMEPITKVNGIIIKLKEQELSGMQREMFI